MIGSGIGRDVVAITTVGGRMSKGSVTLPGSTCAPMRTAVMAMTALLKAPCMNPGFRSTFELYPLSPRHHAHVPPASSRDNLADDIPMHIRQAEIASAETVSQLLVVDA